MGAAYFIVFDNPEPGFDTFVNGKAVARDRDAISAITKKLGLKSIDELTSFSSLAEEFAMSAEYGKAATPWFDAAEGIEWVGKICRHIEANPSSVTERARILSDLKEYEQLLEQGAKMGAKWHFELDI